MVECFETYEVINMHTHTHTFLADESLDAGMNAVSKEPVLEEENGGDDDDDEAISQVRASFV